MHSAGNEEKGERTTGQTFIIEIKSATMCIGLPVCGCVCCSAHSGWIKSHLIRPLEYLPLPAKANAVVALVFLDGQQIVCTVHGSVQVHIQCKDPVAGGLVWIMNSDAAGALILGVVYHNDRW